MISLKNYAPNWAKILYRELKKLTPNKKKRKQEIKNKALLKANKTNKIIKKIYREEQILVLNGPFKGMHYILASNGSQLLPKLLGSYEEPIHRWINEILANSNYTTIIDVGCAEGYYAVGFARANSKPNILAFDVDRSALTNAKGLAKINGVADSIQFAERFDGAAVSKILEADRNRKILIFMDVEGAELDLLDVNAHPSLLECDILVELHDCFISGLTEKIIGFFSSTHKIQIIVDYPWRYGMYVPEDLELPDDDLQFSLDEMRPKEMRWMLAQKR